MSDNVDHLKHLISSTLEHRGVLAKIRAELRQQVFLALDEQEAVAARVAASTEDTHDTTTAHITSKKKRILELHANPAAVDMLELIKDFLECTGLEYTAALLQTEAELTGTPKVSRKQLADKFSLSASPIATQPLLLDLFQRHTNGNHVAERRDVERSSYRAQTSTSPRETAPEVAQSAPRSNRSLYREREREPEEPKPQPQPIVSEAAAEKVSPRLPSPLLAPSSTLSAPGGLGSLAPLGALKKPSLGSLAPLAPLAPLSKPSLGPLSSPAPLQPKPLSPTASSSLSPTNATAAHATTTAKTTQAAQPEPTRASRPVDDELDLDALEAEVFGGGGGGGGSSSQETFMPGGDDETFAPPPASTSSLSSLAAAPSLKPSSLGALAPLAPIGGRSGGSSWGARSTDADSSHDSLPEDDARQVAALDSQIARLTTAKLSAPPVVSASRSGEYDDSFASAGDADAVVDDSGVEEELDIEVESEYEEEEF